MMTLITGLGPLAVAALAEREGLQHALLFVPACYALSGVSFYFADYRLQEMRDKAGPGRSNRAVEKKYIKVASQEKVNKPR